MPQYALVLDAHAMDHMVAEWTRGEADAAHAALLTVRALAAGGTCSARCRRCFTEHSTVHARHLAAATAQSFGFTDMDTKTHGHGLCVHTTRADWRRIDTGRTRSDLRRTGHRKLGGLDNPRGEARSSTL